MLIGVMAQHDVYKRRNFSELAEFGHPAHVNERIVIRGVKVRVMRAAPAHESWSSSPALVVNRDDGRYDLPRGSRWHLSAR
jgi:hypothetical protein